MGLWSLFPVLQLHNPTRSGLQLCPASAALVCALLFVSCEARVCFDARLLIDGKTRKQQANSPSMPKRLNVRRLNILSVDTLLFYSSCNFNISSRHAVIACLITLRIPLDRPVVLAYFSCRDRPTYAGISPRTVGRAASRSYVHAPRFHLDSTSL